MTEKPSPVEALFTESSPSVRETYLRLLSELAAIGPYTEEPREEVIHLAHSFAFAGARPRPNALVLSLRLDGPVHDPRVLRCEQVSANRWQVEFQLARPDDIEDQLRQCLATAMELV